MRNIELDGEIALRVVGDRLRTGIRIILAQGRFGLHLLFSV
jgi:hypothetical protein